MVLHRSHNATKFIIGDDGHNGLVAIRQGFFSDPREEFAIIVAWSGVKVDRMGVPFLLRIAPCLPSLAKPLGT